MLNDLKNNHNLSLSDWGPYTKKYMGISHVAKASKGMRFDLGVFSNIYRRKIEIPHALWESNFHMWEAKADLSYYAYRQELEWKDQLYTDVSFSKMKENQYLISCDIVNNTDKRQNMAIQFMAYLTYPGPIRKSLEELQASKVVIGKGVWICGTNYEVMSYPCIRPKDNLVTDGYRKGQVIENGFVDATGITIGREIGETVSYRIHLTQRLENGRCTIRYKADLGQLVSFKLEGLIEQNVLIIGSSKFECVDIDVGDMQGKTYELKITTLTNIPFLVDGIALYEGVITFEKNENIHKPEIISCGVKNSFILKYENIDHYYGITWLYDDYEIREIFNDELDSFMKYTTHNHVDKVLQGNRKGHYTNAFLKPITVERGEHKQIFGMLTCGDLDEVRQSIEKFVHENNQKNIYDFSKLNMSHFDIFWEGEKYLLSQNIMAATVLTNVTYPIYMKNQYVKHNTPGRWWDCPYTWDSGFCGIGLAQFDKIRAVDCLNAYLTEVGDEETAFIHHGSMVPVQFSLMQEIWAIDQEKELLSFFYPRLKQYYEFYSGRLGSSTTRKFDSNLLSPFDYFYNSGGWDDYPAQVYTHQERLGNQVAPIINTAQCIRIAKIMSLFAVILNQEQDCVLFEDDIKLMTKDLYDYAWDEDSGYFGYVYHDKTLKPKGILRTDAGINFNMGLDGLYPLVAGICNEKIEQNFVEKLMDEKHYFTKIGLTTVDMQAPYYNESGYWNGAVWMPHQYYFWKTMLDLGRYQEAFEIADRALETWKAEVDASYNCFEHFVVNSGRGAGWHQFSGLSTPVVVWFKAYYGHGTVSTGFDLMVTEKNTTNNNTEMFLRMISSNDRKTSTVIVNMNPAFEYEVKVNDTQVQVFRLFGGCLNIQVVNDIKDKLLELKIKKRDER
ncbi:MULTISPECIES: trehalase family glycosidase [unclassified Fusibacter]|uniref:MGH1-like glycoside hydrolase domain-containing protein n=1 Tax=unclassified Fusibacter TaxID=2624464 RepID=UPI00101049F7|nr:trehalase family glycosidase [Fusibacter sp. A1]MCK8061624.1 hypothetical protein [Fusibacter sp. A2]NPE23807.1 hypothetical protein [Fusibacter sp. A1]RXV58645.1 hypothetical protein DWB64_18645 [Fusibacter sp. A1]